MLGEAVYQVFAEKCQVLATDIDLNESWLSMLDVRNKDEVAKVCEAFNPDYIVHLAALTDMEQCEREFENALRLIQNQCSMWRTRRLLVVFRSCTFRPPVFLMVKKKYMVKMICQIL